MTKLKALFWSSHPLPSLAVTLFAVLFGVSANLEPMQLVLVGFAVLTQQFSVGLSNDWIDYQRDKAVARSDKPVATARISPSAVRNAAFGFVLLALGISFAIGVQSGLLMVLMLIAGWSYNLGLKKGLLSVLPYIVGFGILPSFATLSSANPYLPQWWVFLVAALLGVSAHFANVLPDLIDDHKTGVRGLPHALGQKASGVVIAITALAASVIVIFQNPDLTWQIRVFGLLLTILLAVVAAILAFREPPPRLLFPLLVAVSLVNVVLLLVAGI